MEEYERLASDVSSLIIMSMHYVFNIIFHFGIATGMDPPHDAMAELSPDGQLAGRCPEEAGRVPYVPTQAQATTCRAEGQAGDELQYTADQAASVQPTSLHADRGQNGVGHFQQLEGSRVGRKGFRRMVARRDHAPGAS